MQIFKVYLHIKAYYYVKYFTSRLFLVFLREKFLCLEKQLSCMHLAQMYLNMITLHILYYIHIYIYIYIYVT